MSEKVKVNEVKKKGGFGKKIREVFSELKKVTWPTFNKTIRQTGVVIGVVCFFLVMITAADMGLSALLKMLMDAQVTT